MSFDIKIDKETFDAVICDCYREVHPPLRKAKINGHWYQIPYHFEFKEDHEA